MAPHVSTTPNFSIIIGVHQRDQRHFIGCNEAGTLMEYQTQGVPTPN